MAQMIINLGWHKTTFVVRVKRLKIKNLFAAFVVRPEFFLFALRVILNHRVGNVENRLRRAIILFKRDGFRLWVVFFKFQNVANICFSKLVNWLVRIADDADVLLFFGQIFYQGKLQRICVLIFVNQNILKLIVIFLADFGNASQKNDGFYQQIVKVECVGIVQTFFINFKNPRNRGAFLVGVFDFWRIHLEVFTAIFGRTYRIFDKARRKLFVV